MKTEISIRYTDSIVLEKGPVQGEGKPSELIASSLAASMMQYGFVPNKELFERFQTLSDTQVIPLYKSLIETLKALRGADVSYKPFYPNFPKQVMEMSHLELFVNAILHYWSRGEWKPDYEKLPRKFAFESIKFKEIGLITEDEFNKIFNRLVCSNESISDKDKDVVKWFITNRSDISIPDEIPYKENMCVVAGLMLDKGKDIAPLIKTATDVLRVVTYLNDGDVSLAENTKFKSLPRVYRRVFCKLLESVVNKEDIQRHRNKWIKLFHNLHVGDYSDKLFKVASLIRNNKKITTYAGRVQEAIDTNKIADAVNLLMLRPSEFARRVDHLLRLSTTSLLKKEVAEAFISVADQVPTRILLQLLGNLKVRHLNMDKRIVFPKGSIQKAVVVKSSLPKLTDGIITILKDGIKSALVSRFNDLDDLGKIYLDQNLDQCPIPTQQRSASAGLFQVARGTHLPIGDKNTLRFFIYWIGRDIDLSASLHDDKFRMIERISYTHLKSMKYQSFHSGDITRAENGACEFVDITIDGALQSGARYVAMNVFVYSGPTFAEHKKVYAGWMTRDNPNSNEIFDAKTVQQKIDLTSDSKISIPIVFDLEQRKAIWVDTQERMGKTRYGGRNIESNRATTEETLEAIVGLQNKVSLFELFELHAMGRGELVDDKVLADMVFSTDEGVTPFDISIINTEYVV